MKNEINNYSIQDLSLIIDTQQDLYSKEEMKQIESRYEELKNKYIKEHLPSKILCPNCKSKNDFESPICMNCGYDLDKEIYYERILDKMLGYKTVDDNSDEDYEITSETEKSFLFHYIISFIIPFLGFLIGGIMLTSNNNNTSSAGKICIIIGLLSAISSIAIYSIIH